MQALGYQIAPPPWVPSSFAFNQQLPVSPLPVAEKKTTKSQLLSWYGRQHVRTAHTFQPAQCVLSGCSVQVMNMFLQTSGSTNNNGNDSLCLQERSKLGQTCGSAKQTMNIMQLCTTLFNSIHQVYCILGQEAPYAVYSYFVEHLTSGNAFVYISGHSNRSAEESSLHGLSQNQNPPVYTLVRSAPTCLNFKFLGHMLQNHTLLAASVGILVAQQTFAVVMFLAWKSCHCTSFPGFIQFSLSVLLSSVYAMYQQLHCGQIVMALKEHTEANLSLQFALYREQAISFYKSIGQHGLQEVDRNTRVPPGVPFSIIAYLTQPYQKVNLLDISVVVEATQAEIDQLGTFAEERCVKELSMGKIFVFDQKLPDVPVIPIAMIQDKEGSNNSVEGVVSNNNIVENSSNNNNSTSSEQRRLSNHRTPFKLHQRIAVYKWFYVHLSTFPSAQNPVKVAKPSSMQPFYRVKRYKPVPQDSMKDSPTQRKEQEEELAEMQLEATDKTKLTKPVDFDDADSTCIICQLPFTPEHMPSCQWVEVRKSKLSDKARADPRSPRPDTTTEVISFCAASTHCRMHQRCAEAWLWDQATKQCTPKCPVCRLTIPIAVEVVKKVDPIIEDIEQIRRTMTAKRISLSIKDHANHHM